jgi:tRNA A-37 threonylcarbamoyl transferase component Bud32
MKINLSKTFRHEANISEFMGKNGIAPIVEYIDLENNAIVMEKLEILKSHDFYELEKYVNQIIYDINNKINRMHMLGIAHGDLLGMNIVFKIVDGTYKPYFIDWEGSYHINQHGWDVEKWMRRGMTNPRMTYSDYVNNDYRTWNDLFPGYEGHPMIF